MRLVNAAADQHFHFMIDSHTLEVIADDFVPIVPTTQQTQALEGVSDAMSLSLPNNSRAGTSG